MKRREYIKAGVKKGDTGIILGKERNGYVLVYFDGVIYQNEDGVYCTTEIDVGVMLADLIVVD